MPGPVAGSGARVISRRRRRARIYRAYFPLAVASLAAIPIAWMFFPAALLPISIGAAVLGSGLIAGLEAGSDVDGDLAFAAMLPIACLWDSSRLGAFGPSEIVSARVVRNRAQGYAALTSLRIQSKEGGVATFGGFLDLADKDFDRFRAGRTPSPAYADLLRQKNQKERRDFERGIDWLSAHGVALGLSTPREERLRTRRIARVLVAGVSVAGVCGFLIIAGLAAANIVNGWSMDAALLVWSFLVAASAGGSAWMLNEGMAVSAGLIYRPFVTLGIVDRGETLGAEPPSAVASWEIRDGGLVNNNLGRRILEVKFRPRGKGILGDFTDETRFSEVQGWLEENCPGARRG
jgi:hypothetical protein